jgi:hypothetical protein
MRQVPHVQLATTLTTAQKGQVFARAKAASI